VYHYWRHLDDFSVPALPSRVADCARGLVHPPDPPRYSSTHPGEPERQLSTIGTTSMMFPSQRRSLESPTVPWAPRTLPAHLTARTPSQAIQNGRVTLLEALQ